jgi:hypothetical protein
LSNLKANKEAIKTTVDAMTTTITSDPPASPDGDDGDEAQAAAKKTGEATDNAKKPDKDESSSFKTKPASPKTIKTNDIIDASLKWRFQRKAFNKTVRNNLKNNLNKALKDAGIINKDIFESIENKKVLRESNREKEYQFARMQKLAGLEE